MLPAPDVVDGLPDESRRVACLEWLPAGENDDGLQSIRADVVQPRAYGDTRFQAMAAKR